MKNTSGAEKLSRRKFICQQCGRLGLAALGYRVGTAFVGADGKTQSRQTESSSVYETRGPDRPDPSLLGYVELLRFKCPCPEPRRITVTADGIIYVAGEKRVCAFRSDGSMVREIKLNAAPQCVTVGGDGSLYVGFVDHVEVYDKNGSRKAVWDRPEGRPFLSGLATFGDELLVADSGNRIVWRYSLLGKAIGRIGRKDEATGARGFVLPSPHLDVEPDRKGLILVNNPGRHRVECYSLGGKLMSWWGKPTTAIDGFCGCCNPISIAVLPDGRVITCEKGLPRVKVYGADGRLDCVVAGPEVFPENARAGSGTSSDWARVGLDAAADNQGRVYVLDRVTGNILVMVPGPRPTTPKNPEKTT